MVSTLSSWVSHVTRSPGTFRDLVDNWMAANAQFGGATKDLILELIHYLEKHPLLQSPSN